MMTVWKTRIAEIRRQRRSIKKGFDYMTGSLQIKNKKYYMVIHYIDESGKRKNKWISTNLSAKGNKKAALAMLDKWLTDHKGCDISYAGISFADYLTQWIETVKPELQPSTIRGYMGNLKNHILPYFRNRKVKLSELKIIDLENFYNFLLSDAKKLSAQSVRHNHRVISKALNDALRHDLILSNPAVLAKLPKQKKFVASFLNISQLHTLVELFENAKAQSVVKFISTYGTRRSEALGLCWDKVDFDNDQFTICRAFIQGSGGNYLKETTKNESSYRTLPLTTDMKEMLITLKAEQARYRKLLGDSYKESNFVFTWQDGSPISPNYLTRTFHKVVSKSDLPPVRLQDLRHSVASNLLSKGFSLVDIQLWLGHSQPSTTLNFYSHVDSTSKSSIKSFLDNSLDFDGNRK